MIFLIFMTVWFTALQIKDTALGDDYCTYAKTCYAGTYKKCGTWGWSRCRTYRPYTCYYRDCCSGWTGHQCKTPICNTACANGGKCVAPDQCKCPPSHTGDNCQITV